jgi:hypothetical protein
MYGCSRDPAKNTVYTHVYRDVSYGHLESSIRFNTVIRKIRIIRSYFTYLKHFGNAGFWPKMDLNRPNINQTVSNSFPIHCMLLVYYIIAMESRWKAVFGAEVALKRPKIGNCGQILHPYILARFVQFGKIRVKYGTTYYTKTPYDTSLHVCMVLANPIYLSVESSKWQSFAFRLYLLCPCVFSPRLVHS